MYILDLTPQHSNRKSFYGKAKVIINDNGTVQLQSYNTLVCEIDEYNKFKMLWDGKSQTTTRHIKEFRQQFNDLIMEV